MNLSRLLESDKTGQIFQLIDFIEKFYPEIQIDFFNLGDENKAKFEVCRQKKLEKIIMQTASQLKTLGESFKEKNVFFENS